MDELLHHFLIECREVTQQVAEDLAALARSPGEMEPIDSLFRGFHTLKGSSALFDFAPLTGVLHAAESLLADLRGGRVSASPAIIEILLTTAGQVEDWLDAVERSGALPADAAARAALLEQRLAGMDGGREAAPAAAAAPTSAPWVEAVQAELGHPPDALTAIRYTPAPGAYFRGDDPVAALHAVPELRGVTVEPREPFADLETYDPYQCNLVLQALSAAPLAEVHAALRLVADEVELVAITAEAENPTLQPVRSSLRSLRIDAERIDALAAVVDELVIAKNNLGLLVGDVRKSSRTEELARGLTEAQAGIDRLVSRLHAAVTRVRLVPLSPLFSRFPRAARETATALGKDVELVLRGEDVEVDKAIVDGLYEPLLHLVRNAIDHGIEAGGEREAVGKPRRGVITISARSVGDQVLIEVVDDGRGIDPERTRAAAVARGLVTREAASRLTDDEATNLIFAPGFSTASQVSEVSGRGVGMDAVRTAVLRLGGRITLISAPGLGATVRLALPVSVVLSKIMVVAAGNERFGLPLDTISETARIGGDDIMKIRAGEAFLLRDRPVPLLHLHDLLGLPRSTDAADRRVVIVSTDDGPVAIAVDDFAGRMDAPLRPMTGLLAGMPGVVGTTLLGDGQVLMVLNVGELIG